MAEGKNMAAHWGQIAYKRAECMKLLAVLAQRALLPEERVRLDDLAYKSECYEEVVALEKAILKIRLQNSTMRDELTALDRKRARSAQPSLFGAAK
jgi:hypothetical protein